VSDPGDPWIFELPAGAYVVQAEYGSARVATEVEVRAGEMTEQIIEIDGES
jgi:hypothetical protein